MASKQTNYCKVFPVLIHCANIVKSQSCDSFLQESTKIDSNLLIHFTPGVVSDLGVLIFMKCSKLKTLVTEVKCVLFSNIMLATLGTLLVMGGIMYFVLGRRSGAAGKSGISGNPFVSFVAQFYAHEQTMSLN